MNIKAISTLTPATSKMAFGFACALLVSAGWGTKIGLEQLGDLSDQTSASISHRPPESVRDQRRKLETPPPQTPTSPDPTQFSPTNPTVPLIP